MPIPASLLIDLNLCTIDSEDDKRALLCETERKLSLLAADRHLPSVLCTVGVLEDHACRARLDVASALWERLKRHDAATPRMLLALEMGDSDARCADIDLVHCREVAVVVELNQPEARIRQYLLALRRASRAAAGDMRLSVYLKRSADSSAALAVDHGRVSCIAEFADSIVLTLLFASAPAADDDRSSEYGRLSAVINGSGLYRTAPCVFARDELRTSGAHEASLAMPVPCLPTLEVIGLGPGAVSQFGPARFANYAAPSAYRSDLARGGFALAAASRLSAVDLLTAELLCRLHGGQAIDPPGLCTPYDGALPERCATSLRAMLAGLHREGLLSARAGGSYALAPSEDFRLGEVSARLRRWLASESDGEVLALRQR